MIERGEEPVKILLIAFMISTNNFGEETEQREWEVNLKYIPHLYKSVIMEPISV